MSTVTFMCRCRFRTLFYCPRRCLSAKLPDNQIESTVKGYLDSWMTKYEDFVGLTIVRQAQSQVLQAEAKFGEIQEKRRNANKEMTDVNAKLKVLATELEKTSRGTDRYLELVTKENAIIREENDLAEQVKNLEEEVRGSFAVLSSALRDSHEKERAQGEKTKYWSIIGSVIGATIGMIGTTINNRMRMKELRGIVQTSAGTTEDYKKIAGQLCETVTSQNSKHETLLSDIRVAIGNSSNSNQKLTNISSHQISDIIDMLKSQNIKFTSEMADIKSVLGVGASSLSKTNVVYVGPQMEEMLSKTERNLEWKIKIGALATVTFIYGALALTIPLIFSFFKGD